MIFVIFFMWYKQRDKTYGIWRQTIGKSYVADEIATDVKQLLLFVCGYLMHFYVDIIILRCSD